MQFMDLKQGEKSPVMQDDVHDRSKVNILHFHNSLAHRFPFPGRMSKIFCFVFSFFGGVGGRLLRI